MTQTENQNRSTREEVYEAIDGERAYQDDKFIGGGRAANDRSLDEMILYMEQYLAEAKCLSTHEDEELAHHFVRKVVALGVGCMERHGARHRGGYEPKPGHQVDPHRPATGPDPLGR